MSHLEKFETAAIQALTDVEYERMQELIFKASVGAPQVEHFIYFTGRAASKGSFRGWFGIRNREAEKFSVKCIHMAETYLMH